MNVYDFDGTIYRGDSTKDFYLHCLRHNPRMLAQLPANGVDCVRFALHRIARQDFKERFMRRLLPRVDASRMVASFWETHRGRLQEWYLEQRDASDLIISASPQFLLQPLCDELGVSLIATPVDPATGEFLGANMRGEEKVRAFYEAYPHATPASFYSDSMSDAPMMRLAEQAFLVSGTKITPVDRHALS